jgi:hypothetical protein
MAKFLIIKILTPILLVTFSILAFSAEKTALDSCAEVFNKNDKYQTSETQLPKSSSFTLVSSVSTVKILKEKLPGRHGGELMIFSRKLFKPWLSDVKKSPNMMDPQGTPFGFVYATSGGKIPTFFGFKTVKSGKFSTFLGLKSNMVTVPDIAELNGAIKVINPHLKTQKSAPITVEFYPGGLEVTDRSYLTSYASKHQLPMATKGHLGIHDASYHTTALLLPPKIIEFSANRAQRVVDFISFLEKKGVPADSIGSMEIMRVTASQIDITSGNLAAVAYADYHKMNKDSNYHSQAYNAIYRPASANHQSADEAIKQLVSNLSDETKKIYQELFNEFIKNNPDSKYSTRLNLSGYDVPNTTLDKKEIIVAEANAFVRLLNYRVAEIDRAVAAADAADAKINN